MDLQKIKLIREYKLPKTKKRVRAFVRFTNYYKAFINKFVITAAALIAFTGKYPFYWISKA